MKMYVWHPKKSIVTGGMELSQSLSFSVVDPQNVVWLFCASDKTEF